MSLLLDALKKAAKDKAQAGHSAATAANIASEQQHEQEDIAFSLDEPAEAASTPASSIATTPGIEMRLASQSASATPNTVSDEALYLLIHKTNQEYRRYRKAVWISTLVGSVVVLVISGVYFLNTMQTQVASQEKQHQIMMRTVNEVPVKSNPKSANTPDSHVAVAATKTAATLKPAPTRTAATTQQHTVRQAKAEQKTAENTTAGNMSIQRGHKNDPMGALLGEAWNAFNASDYDTATARYREALGREPNNRDALLGMAGIAMKSADKEQARQFYARLLQLNPRDEFAYDAMHALGDANSADLGEAKLHHLIKQNPEAPHLYFALGNVYANQAKWPEAQSAYFNAWQRRDDNPDYAFNLAVSLDRMGKATEAARYYANAIALAQNINSSFAIEAAQNRLNQLQP